MQIDPLEVLRYELDPPVLDRLDGRLGEDGLLHEPLLGDARLDHRTAPITGADRVRMRGNVAYPLLGFEIAEQRRAGRVPIQAGIGTGLVVERGIVVHNADGWQVVALPQLVVVGIVTGRDLHRAGAERGLHRCVGNNGNAPAERRQDGLATDQSAIAFVVRMHRDGCIAEDRLRACRGHLDVAAAFEVVAHRPELACRLLMHHFEVGDHGAAARTPVHQVRTAVDQPLVVEAHEGLAHGTGELIVECEPQPRPIARCAELAEL